MLDIAFNETVVLRKPVSRTSANAVQYSVVREADGEESRMRLLIDRRKRVVEAGSVKEVATDATAVYRSDKWPGSDVRIGWIMVDSRGECYEIADLSEAFSAGAWYRRAEMKLTRQVVLVEGN